MAKRGMEVQDAGTDPTGLVKPPPTMKIPQSPSGFVPTTPTTGATQ